MIKSDESVKPCPMKYVCDGDWKVRDREQLTHPEDCPVCHGTGQVRVRAGKDRIDCPKCGAKGMYFVSLQMCGLCDTGNA
jgi:DnaJ-class molecular chaperone